MPLKPPRLRGISKSEIILHLKMDGYYPVYASDSPVLLQKYVNGKIITVTSPGTFRIIWRNKGQRRKFWLPCNHVLERMGEVFKYSDVFCVIIKVDHMPQTR